MQVDYFREEFAWPDARAGSLAIDRCTTVLSRDRANKRLGKPSNYVLVMLGREDIDHALRVAGCLLQSGFPEFLIIASAIQNVGSE